MAKFLTLWLLGLVIVPTCLQAQTMTELPNPDMEVWIDTLDYPKLEGWWDSHNNWAVPNNISNFGLNKTFVTVQNGLFSAKLETVIGDVFNLDIFRKYIPGVITNGEAYIPGDTLLDDEVGVTFIRGGQPFEGMLDKWTGYYDFRPEADEDTAWFYIKLWQNDGTVIGEGELLVGANSGGFVPFEVPVTYTVTMAEPDSMLMIIASSQNPSADNVGTELYIDNMAFEFAEEPIGLSYVEQNGIAVRPYPNPAHGSFILDNPYNEDAVVTLYNTLGAAVLRQPLDRGLNTVSLGDLVPGTYAYRMTATSGVLIADGLFAVK